MRSSDMTVYPLQNALTLTDLPACNGTIISDEDSKGLGEVIQLQGDQRNKIKEFLTGKDNGLGLEGNTIKVRPRRPRHSAISPELTRLGPRLLGPPRGAAVLCHRVTLRLV